MWWLNTRTGAPSCLLIANIALLLAMSRFMWGLFHVALLILLLQEQKKLDNVWILRFKTSESVEAADQSWWDRDDPESVLGIIIWTGRWWKIWRWWDLWWCRGGATPRPSGVKRSFLGLVDTNWNRNQKFRFCAWSSVVTVLKTLGHKIQKYHQISKSSWPPEREKQWSVSSGQKS